MTPSPHSNFRVSSPLPSLVPFHVNQIIITIYLSAHYLLQSAQPREVVRVGIVLAPIYTWQTKVGYSHRAETCILNFSGSKLRAWSLLFIDSQISLSLVED